MVLKPDKDGREGGRERKRKREMVTEQCFS